MRSSKKRPRQYDLIRLGLLMGLESDRKIRMEARVYRLATQVQSLLGPALDQQDYEFEVECVLQSAYLFFVRNRFIELNGILPEDTGEGDRRGCFTAESWIDCMGDLVERDLPLHLMRPTNRPLERDGIVDLALKNVGDEATSVEAWIKSQYQAARPNDEIQTPPPGMFEDFVTWVTAVMEATLSAQAFLPMTNAVSE